MRSYGEPLRHAAVRSLGRCVYRPFMPVIGMEHFAHSTDLGKRGRKG